MYPGINLQDLTFNCPFRLPQSPTESISSPKISFSQILYFLTLLCHFNDLFKILKQEMSIHDRLFHKKVLLTIFLYKNTSFWNKTCDWTAESFSPSKILNWLFHSTINILCIRIKIRTILRNHSNNNWQFLDLFSTHSSVRHFATLER